MEHGEDAGVYRLTDDLALIQTVDFFTPIVDDPYFFGQIAVANSLSDVYAMGGMPLTALNIVCFPVQKMPLTILKEILRGGLDKMREAGVLLVGGHSVDDEELKYGLAVTGVVHPNRVLLNQGAKEGDLLLLTKPLGTGIVNTAVKARMAPPDVENAAVETMKALNKTAADIITKWPGVHACTDITGFGLIGHLCEMIEDAGVGVVINTREVPLLPGLQDLVETGLVPGGLYRNKQFRLPYTVIDDNVPGWLVEVLFDPQTSGGLLIAVEKAQGEELMANIKEAGIKEARIIGSVTDKFQGKIVIQ
jgi:selenide,water dikinase